MGLEGTTQQADALRFAILQVINRSAGRFVQPKISADFPVAATDRRLGQIEGGGCRRHRATQLEEVEGVEAIK